MRFKSIPVEPDGHAVTSDVRVHEARFSSREPYLVAGWVSAGIFLVSTSLLFLVCFVARKGGYHIVVDGEERFLPPFLGLVLALPAFTAALKAEVHLRMHMRALEDRACNFGRFRFFPNGRPN